MAVKQDILDIYAKEVEGIKEAGLFQRRGSIASLRVRVAWRTEEKSSTCAPTTTWVLAMTSA